jgi:hypothetical protein
MHSSLFHIIPNFWNAKVEVTFFVSVDFFASLLLRIRKRVEILRAGSLEANERIASNAQRLLDSVLNQS